jgi:hypothetical protein
MISSSIIIKMEIKYIITRIKIEIVMETILVIALQIKIIKSKIKFIVNNNLIIPLKLVLIKSIIMKSILLIIKEAIKECH